MKNFHDLVESRRKWIHETLVPWCKTAERKDLLLAEQEWVDLAGRPDPELTLWAWAWNRFPELCDPNVGKLNETHQVTIFRKNGTQVTGYPDARTSQAGLLFLITDDGKTVGPVSIDDVESVEISG
ncbi:hypothetical protein KOR42_08910 [Thalassoglobus neptunius]|uniref:Uncharacterized protein n=1 Tax=Thalassoglobus neptunius TaxID=1938619 RepID=A0A5C5X3U3_9PLAN|nr:hypothetical protein [Thalassoglobus neptunius]TWT57530.1 hypothetical protein KOR42_08910 [Thalassoglobus neptunius]